MQRCSTAQDAEGVLPCNPLSYYRNRTAALAWCAPGTKAARLTNLAATAHPEKLLLSITSARQLTAIFTLQHVDSLLVSLLTAATYKNSPVLAVLPSRGDHAGSEPGDVCGSLGDDAGRGQDLRGNAASCAQHGPPRMDDLAVPAASQYIVTCGPFTSAAKGPGGLFHLKSMHHSALRTVHGWTAESAAETVAAGEVAAQ